jgi:DNA polymerase-3 subunit epsilon
MKLIALIDTETTGLDPRTDDLIEVAVAHYDLDFGQIVELHSYLLYAESNAAEAINGIPAELLRHRGRHFDCDRDLFIAQDIASSLTRADAVVAWNVAFDRPWIENFLRGFDVIGGEKLPWVCAMDDIEWPKASTSKGLVATALAHGVGVTDAHRATADVLTMARLFSRARELGADLSDMVERGARPKAEFRAVVTYEQREAAKRAGFRWDGERKGWFRKLVVGEPPTLPFAVERAS